MAPPMSRDIGYVQAECRHIFCPSSLAQLNTRQNVRSAAKDLSMVFSPQLVV